MKMLLKLILLVTLVITTSSLPQLVNGAVTLQLRGKVIPSNGAGSVLITDIGPGNDDALLCISDQRNCCSGSGNWFVKYGSPQQRRVQSDDSMLGWMRNRGRNPTVVRLRSRTSDPQPGQSQEGVYTCEMMGDGVVSVGLYYSLDVQVTFQLNLFLVNPTYSVTCTVTGGTVLHSSFSVPGGEDLGSVSPVGMPERRGLDIYRSMVTRATGNHGDTFTCMASNGASTATSNYTLSAATAPSNVTWEQVASSVLHVRWSQPAGGAPVRSYTITATYGNGVVAAYLTLKPHSRLVIIQRLVNDGRMYTISVIAMSDHLPGIASFTAYLTQLSPPLFTVTNITGTTANLTLLPPVSLTTVTPDSYLITMSLVMIEGRPGGCPHNGSNRMISMNYEHSFVIVDDLEEASSYRVTAQARSQVMGDSSPNSLLLFNTSAKAPSEPPRNLQVREVTSSSVQLVWESLNSCYNVNGIPKGWQVLYWKSQEGMLSSLAVPGSPLVAGSVNLTGLQSYTNYTFQVAAVSGNQLIGMYCNSVTALTLETDLGGVDGEREGEGCSSDENRGVCIQFQFGPTDHCTIWTEDKARNAEKEILAAVSDFITLDCPNCTEVIFQGQLGMFICHDNPHSPTYRFCPVEYLTPLVLTLIQQWVSSEPSIQVGWLLARVNPHCPVVIPSLDVAEQPVATVPTHQMIPLTTSSPDLIDMCMTEIQRVCNTTS